MKRSTTVAGLTAALLTTTAGIAGAATRTADYGLRGTYASSDAGAADLVPIDPGTGTGTFGPDAAVGHDDYQFAANQGLLGAVGPGVADGSFSVVLLVRLDAVTGYRRLVDWKARTSDTGLYVLNGHLNFYNRATGPDANIPAGTFVQVVLTRDVAGTVTGYVDGTPELTFDDSAAGSNGLAVPSTDSALRYVIDDTAFGGEASSGALARVQVYDDALSSAAVAALPRDPAGSPPPSLPELPLPVLLPAVALLGAGAVVARRRRVG